MGKVVVLVLEGMSNKLLDSWCQKGYLPSLAKLRENQGGFLESLPVPYEASALQTAFTGYSPGDHGVFSYWKVHNPEYIPKVWDSKELYKQYLWQREDLKEKKFGVINIFGTHPPYPINGSMITYLFNQSLHACYPKNLLHQYAKEGLGYGHDVSVFYQGQARNEFLQGLFQVFECQVKAALRMLREVDVLIGNLTLADRVSHFYWQEIEDDSSVTLENSALLQTYKMLDRAIEDFIMMLGDQSNLLVFSDIGFGPLREFISVNELLRQGGFLVRTGSNETQWDKTKAFETVQGSHGININQKGIFAKGMIEKSDYRSMCKEVTSYLTQLINPKTGLRYFSDVIPREELYYGEHCNEAPDLILCPADERYLPRGDDYWAKRVHREYQSGWHRRECFWTGLGPDLNRVKKDGVMADIAPTILQLCGKDNLKGFNGNSLLR